MEKFLTDLKDLMYDDQMFSHAVDEMIAFDSELRQQHGYPTSLPSPMAVLSKPESFTKWIRIEGKCKCH